MITEARSKAYIRYNNKEGRAAGTQGREVNLDNLLITDSLADALNTYTNNRTQETAEGVKEALIEALGGQSGDDNTDGDIDEDDAGG